MNSVISNFSIFRSGFLRVFHGGVSWATVIFIAVIVIVIVIMIVNSFAGRRGRIISMVPFRSRRENPPNPAQSEASVPETASASPDGLRSALGAGIGKEGDEEAGKTKSSKIRTVLLVFMVIIYAVIKLMSRNETLAIMIALIVFNGVSAFLLPERKSRIMSVIAAGLMSFFFALFLIADVEPETADYRTTAAPERSVYNIDFRRSMFDRFQPEELFDDLHRYIASGDYAGVTNPMNAEFGKIYSYFGLKQGSQLDDSIVWMMLLKLVYNSDSTLYMIYFGSDKKLLTLVEYRALLMNAQTGESISTREYFDRHPEISSFYTYSYDDVASNMNSIALIR